MVPEIVVVLLSHWYEYDLIEPHAGVIAPYATLRSHPGGGGRVVVVGVGGVLNNAVTVAPIARSTFEMGNIEGLTAEQVKTYIRWIANRRLSQLRLKEIYEVKENPLTWLDDMLNGVEHMNFFEGRATEYSKASTKGSWVEAFEFTK